MNEFLRTIHCSIFKKWVTYQLENYHLEENDDVISFHSKNANGHIGFYDNDIIEMQIVSTKSEEVEFYLHFQFQNFLHAKDLFSQMNTTLQQIEESKTIKVLLSCSSALTTSMFASMLEESAKENHLDMHFEALPVTDLLYQGDNYDLIMLAPQVSYQLPKLKNTLKAKIIALPAQIFARYDTIGALALINETLSHKEEKEEKKLFTIQRHISDLNKVLTICFIRHRKNTKISYRIYDHNKEIHEENMILCHVGLSDLNGILDQVFHMHPDIKKICISLPGTTDGESIINTYDDFKMKGFKSYLENKYKKTFYLLNDTNACLIGIHATLKDYKDIGLYYVGKGNNVGGSAFILNDHLIYGKNGFAGEIRYMHKQYENGLEMVKTEEGAMLVAKSYIIPMIAFIAPAVIAVYSDMIPNINELKSLISEDIPEEYLPEFIKIDRPLDYMHLGSLMHISFLDMKNKNLLE